MSVTPENIIESCKEHRLMSPQCLREAETELAALRAENARLFNACVKMEHEIQQVVGKALGYPWFKDDQKNFPCSIEADGVCVGEHVAVTLADEAAATIADLRRQLAEADARTAKAVEEEREACAKIVEETSLPEELDDSWDGRRGVKGPNIIAKATMKYGDSIAAAIRERGSKGGA